ncbi:MAG: hypothetical protein JNM07_05395 [Phycisphaerae bacterium]|nr:hypothetical protein [Phycisphaerae bacterium]
MARRAGNTRPTPSGSARREATSPPPAPARRGPKVLRYDEVLGQSRATDVLRAAAQSRRVHSTWVFHGPSGVGKFTTAVAFGAVLLGGDETGTAEAARLIRAATHPDFHVITKELSAYSRDPRVREQLQNNIPKAVIEEFLIDPAALAAVGGAGIKVFIVDEAERLDPIAQNSLLKLTEEPPPGTVIIMVTASEDRLLPTIRSRAQRVGFMPLGAEDMERWARSHEAEHGAAIDPHQRAWLIGVSGGSPGAMWLALEEGLTAWRDAIEPLLDVLLEGDFPSALASTMERLVEERAVAAVERDPAASKEAANKFWARRLVAFVGESLRSRIRQSPRLARAAATWIERFDAAQTQIEANVKIGFALEGAVAGAGLDQP